MLYLKTKQNSYTRITSVKLSSLLLPKILFFFPKIKIKTRIKPKIKKEHTDGKAWLLPREPGKN